MPLSLSLLLVVIIGFIAILIWLRKKEVPFIQQEYPWECGPRCLQMILKYYGDDIHINRIIELTEMTPNKGTSLMHLSDTAKVFGFRTLSVKLPFYEIKGEASFKDIPLPCIAHWEWDWFVVVEKYNNYSVGIVHPEEGKIEMSHEEFIQKWAYEDGERGILLLFERNKA